MADTYTTNLNLTKPEPGAAEDTWGISLNADLDSLDAIFSSSGTQINLNPNQINFADSKKAIFGTGGDLQIYHTGTASIIEDQGTGDLVIRGTDLYLRNSSNSNRLYAGTDVRLYYNGSEKIRTTSTGIDVTGTVTSDGLTVDGSGSNIRYDVASSNPHTNPTLHLENQNTTDGNVAALMLSADNANGVGGSAYIYAQSETTNQKGNLVFAREDGANTPVTSMKLSSNGDISFYEDTGTSQALYWDASNESLGLGLGITAPVYALDLANASGGNLARFKDSDSSYNGIIIAGDTNAGWVGNSASNTGEGIYYQNSINAMRFYANGSEKMRIDSSGKVGIGTTNPERPLHISGTNTIAAEFEQTSASGEVRVLLEAGGTSSQLQFSGASHASLANTLTIASANHTRFVQAGQTVMYLDSGSGGRVGIGTTAPSAKLDVSATSGSSVQIKNTGTAASLLLAIDSSQNSIYSRGATTSTARDLRFIQGSSEVARLDASGNLLVGTTDTSLYNNTTGEGFSVVNSELGIAKSGSSCAYFNRMTSDGDTVKLFNRGVQVGSISTTSSATAYNTSSDARLKDVTGSARGLEVINELNPVAYNWKANGKADEGLIAQEVIDIVPNAVSGSEEEMYQMDYSKLVVHLIAGMKEQQAQIEALQSEINELKNS